jgi:hypothetical protein
MTRPDRTLTQLAIAYAFTRLGAHIAKQIAPRGGDGFPFDVSAEEFLNEWRDYSPFVKVLPDPTDSDGVTKLALCMVCGNEMDDTTVAGCPNHDIEHMRVR